jgi:adenosine deaminase
MAKQTYTIYVDGVKAAEGLTVNGTNYVSESEVDTSRFQDDVFKLTVKDNEGNVVEEHEYAKLLQQMQYAWDDNKYYLAFCPVSEQEVKFKEMQANLEFLAMCNNVDFSAN